VRRPYRRISGLTTSIDVNWQMSKPTLWWGWFALKTMCCKRCRPQAALRRRAVNA
jgi:hypothetical protein